MKLLNVYQPYLNNLETKAVSKVLKSGWLTNGKTTFKFEKKIEKFLKCNHALTVNSCTNGLNSVLHALGLKKGDEIITSPMTFISSIHNLYNLGLKIKLIDIDIKNYNIDINLLKKKITNKTKCILVTHYGGLPCEMNQIFKICKNKKIFIVEDAATALGAKINNKMVGSFDNSTAVFSLYANKIITTGEGGIITTKNRNLFKKLKIITQCGIDKSPWKRSFSKKNYFFQAVYPGFKYNFTDIQSAIGLEQIKKLNKIIKYRKYLKKIYQSNLKELIKKKIIKLQESEKKLYSSEYIFTILLNNKKIKFKRNDLTEYLKKKKINTTVHYIPANKHKFYNNKFKNFNLKNSDYVYENILSVPYNNHLKKTDIIYICKHINEFILRNSI